MSCILAVVSIFCVSTALGDPLVHRFGPGSFGDPAWSRRYNPASETFSLTHEGWVAKYPPNAGTGEPMNTGGFRSRFALEGDFRVTLDYRLDRADQPETGNGVGVLLRLSFEAGTQFVALGHVRKPDGKLVHFVNVNQGEVKNYRQFPAVLGTHVASIERVGNEFVFAIKARGGQTSELIRFNGPTSRADDIEIWATSGNTSTPLTVSLASVAVDASDLPVGTLASEELRFPWRWISVGLILLAIGTVVISKLKSPSQESG